MSTNFDKNHPAVFKKEINIAPDLLSANGQLNLSKIAILFQQLASDN